MIVISPHAMREKLATGQATEEELLALASWAHRDPHGRERLREAWPTDQFPIFDDYFCVAQLGHGASGVVFKALFVSALPSLVALKLLRPGCAEAEQRFREREIEILKALQCAHVARYLDSGSAGGTAYLAMEFVKGRPLDEYLRTEAGSLEDKLVVFQRLCGIVADVHEAGVIHRDLKPRHVLVDEHGIPALVDFGISTVRTEDWPTRVRRAQTELGRILGTVKYMSPEQAWGGMFAVDHRTDIWALGMMLYEIATDGDYPYDIDPVGDLTGHDALLHRLQTQMPRKPRIVASENAGALSTLISRCLAHEPARRIPSAEALATDLGRCLAHKPIRTRGLPLWYRLQRIGVGLAAHWRMGLWTSTVSSILIFLILVSMVSGARWRVSDTDFGSETRKLLADTAEDPLSIIAISDRTCDVVPALARGEGLEDVTREVTTWRALHGRIMTRLARAKPRAVLWDFAFQSPHPDDSPLAAGIRALEDAGVPVVLGVFHLDATGRPLLSQTLLKELGADLRYGMILGLSSENREGEVLVAMRRDDAVHPGMALAAMAAIVHPTCAMEIDWPISKDNLIEPSSRTLLLQYRYRPPTDAPLPTVDRVALTNYHPITTPVYYASPGDFVGGKAFTLQRPEHWAGRTIPYETLLTADARKLASLVGGKVIFFGDLRFPGPNGIPPGDRHDVRYGTEVIKDVPGCYVLADAICGLLRNQSLAVTTPLGTPALFIAVVLSAFAACWLPSRWSAWTRVRFRGARALTLVALLLGATVCIGVTILSRDRTIVYVAMISASGGLAMAASFAIECTRNRYHITSVDS